MFFERNHSNNRTQLSYPRESNFAITPAYFGHSARVFSSLTILPFIVSCWTASAVSAANVCPIMFFVLRNLLWALSRARSPTFYAKTRRRFLCLFFFACDVTQVCATLRNIRIYSHQRNHPLMTLVVSLSHRRISHLRDERINAILSVFFDMR